VARIKQESIDEVKATADILDVIGARTQLRKSGARYVGRCPFHEERTPSFSVNPVDKLYYCFGCGTGGDLVSFVRKTENLDFAGAVEWLADRFRVQLQYEETSPRLDAQRERRRRLYALLEQAASFYERVLWDSSAGQGAREYLAGRGLGAEVCREFRLGFAPAEGLAGKARERGFTDAELRDAGLVNARGNDYFPPRLMFPLADARGRVVGFQARKLREDDPLRGKYVNSPEGTLFHKGAILYGLHLARAAMAKQGQAAVVEGNTDVIALRQAGFEPVVASMGTALTELHVRELARLVRRLYLCFDADAAGEDATLRGMELAARHGLDVRIVTLPKGQDPADAPDGFERRLAASEAYLVYRVRLEIERASDRQEAFVRAREVLARFAESPERQDALRLAADRLDLPPDLQAGLAPRALAATGTVSEKVLEAGDRLERDALAGFLAHRELVPLLAELSPDHFDADIHRTLCAHLVDGTEPAPELVPLLAELDARAAAEAIDEATTKELALRLRERGLRRELSRLNGDLARTKELQEALERVRRALDGLA
jgi:DNA primase